MIAYEQIGSGSLLVALHGILGRRSNWRSFVKRSITMQGQDAGGILVDLREHGESAGRQAPPHTLMGCAHDLLELHRSLPSLPVAALGHSFGGKVAIAYAYLRLEQGYPLERLFIIDSTPGPRKYNDVDGEDSVQGIVAALKTVTVHHDSRDAFIAAIQQVQPMSMGVGRWLAMNLVREESGFRLGIDPNAIADLLLSYSEMDAWDLLSEVSKETAVHFVLGGKSTAVPKEDQDALHKLAEASAHHLQVSTVPDAGHWVHVSSPAELLALIGQWSKPPNLATF